MSGRQRREARGSNSNVSHGASGHSRSSSYSGSSSTTASASASATAPWNSSSAARLDPKDSILTRTNLNPALLIDRSGSSGGGGSGSTGWGNDQGYSIRRGGLQQQQQLQGRAWSPRSGGSSSGIPVRKVNSADNLRRSGGLRSLSSPVQPSFLPQPVKRARERTSSTSSTSSIVSFHTMNSSTTTSPDDSMHFEPSIPIPVPALPTPLLPTLSTDFVFPAYRPTFASHPASEGSSSSSSGPPMMEIVKAEVFGPSESDSVSTTKDVNGDHHPQVPEQESPRRQRRSVSFVLDQDEIIPPSPSYSSYSNAHSNGRDPLRGLDSVPKAGIYSQVSLDASPASSSASRIPRSVATRHPKDSVQRGRSSVSPQINRSNGKGHDHNRYPSFVSPWQPPTLFEEEEEEEEEEASDTISMLNLPVVLLRTALNILPIQTILGAFDTAAENDLLPAETSRIPRSQRRQSRPPETGRKVASRARSRPQQLRIGQIRTMRVYLQRTLVFKTVETLFGLWLAVIWLAVGRILPDE